MLMHEIPARRIRALIIAVVASCCCCGGFGFYLLRPWSPPSHSLLGARLPNVNAIQIFAYSQDRLIVWDTDGNLSLIDGSTGKSYWTHKAANKILSVDVRDNSVASLSAQGEISILDGDSGRNKRTFNIQKPVDEFHSPRNIKLSPNGRSVATVDRDLRFRLWDIATGRELAKVELKGVWIGQVDRFAGSGQEILCSGDVRDIEGNSFLIELPSARLLKTFPGASQPQFLNSGSVALVSADTKLALYDKAGTEAWSLEMTDRIWKFFPNEDESRAIVSMPGRSLWLGGRTSLVDLKTGTELANLEHPDQPMPSLEWVSNRPIAGGSDGSIYMYNMDGKPIASLVGSKVDIRHIVLAGSFLYSVDEEGGCYRWSLAELKK